MATAGYFSIALAPPGEAALPEPAPAGAGVVFEVAALGAVLLMSGAVAGSAIFGTCGLRRGVLEGSAGGDSLTGAPALTEAPPLARELLVTEAPADAGCADTGGLEPPAGG